MKALREEKMNVKKEIRILGIDDAPFTKGESKEVLVIGTIFRGGESLDGILRTYITCDGNDATDKIVRMINESKHKPQLKVIMTDGIALGGFNILDVQEIFKKTGLPVIVVMRKYPDIEKIKSALMKFEDWEERFLKLRKAGKIHKLEVGTKEIYFQFTGLQKNEAEKILKLTLKRGLVPEPLRIAHLIATAIIFGESRGRA